MAFPDQTEVMGCCDNRNRALRCFLDEKPRNPDSRASLCALSTLSLSSPMEWVLYFNNFTDEQLRFRDMV